MIDFMTSWCGWCKKLDDEVYTKPDVMEMSTRFVCIRVDAEQRSDLARIYAVDSYPTHYHLPRSDGPANEPRGRLCSGARVFGRNA